MKRLFQRRFFNRKWAVPVAALVLSLSVGSIAFATTGSGSGGSVTSSTVSSASVADPTTTTLPAAPTTAVAPASSGTRVPGATTEISGGGVLSSDQLAAEQAKENAILDLIREKMTSADQATFDQLRATATEDQTVLQQAQADLNDTTTKINALVDKYLGVSTSTDSGSTGTDSGSTSTGASSTSTNTGSTNSSSGVTASTEVTTM